MAIDYKSFSSDGKEQKALDKRWWLAKSGKDLAQSASMIVKKLAEYDKNRHMQYNIDARLYGNSSIMGVNGISFSKASQSNTTKDRIAFNLVGSCVDTLVSKQAKNKPRAMFLTSGGNWKTKRKAKKLEKFVDGVLYENDIDSIRGEVRRDAYVWGDGFVQVFEDNGRVRLERVLAGELYVDWVEAFYGKPRQLHRVKNVDRDVLKDLFPKKSKVIDEANGATQDQIGIAQNVADQVTVFESWRLPSGPDANDGIHVIYLENDTLETDDYKKQFFPFARRRWAKHPVGYWSQSIPGQIASLQLELNKMLWVEQRSYHLAGSFKILVENGSKVVKEHLNNDVGAIVTYTGVKPEYVIPPVLPPGFEQRKQFIINSAYQQIGISQLSAQSQKPAGLNSGKALREYNDIESDRFLSDGQDEERFVLELSKLIIDCAKDIYEREGKYQVKVPGSKFVQTIDWKDVDLEEDEYVLKMFPVSQLPKDPAGRLQTVQEYAQAGYLSPRAAKRLLDFPDLEQIDDLQSAEEDYLHMILEKITDEGEYTPPEPQDDLQLALELSLEYYAQGKRDNLDEDKLELLRQFQDQVKLLTQKAMPPAPMGAPGAPGGAPQAVPEAPPTSGLLPNAPGAA